MRLNSKTRKAVIATVTSTVLAGGFIIATGGAAVSATCPDVEVVFARGSGELPGLGMVGGPFADALSAGLSDYSVESYAVDYAADYLQTSSSAGAADMGQHIQTVAAACPETRFVIGGYSQGATVTDKAIGISSVLTGGDQQIPNELADRVVALVVFGNPLGLTGGTIATTSPTYGPRSQDYCNSFDIVCGFNLGGSFGGHLAYPLNGSAEAGAQFAVEQIRSGT